MRSMLILLAAACLHVGSAEALVISFHENLATWQATAGASTLQDFSTFAEDTSMLGAEVLPGVIVTTNLGALKVRNAEKTIFASGSGSGSRLAGNAFYELQVNNAYGAVALEVGSFESAEAPFNVAGGAIGPGHMEILLSDNQVFNYDLFGNDSLTNKFFGVVADIPITRIRWYEAFEAGDLNEETTLDNLRVARATPEVPEPSSLALAAGGLMLLVGARRRIV